ncbi:hypothetical protein PYCCODRAFT_1469016 [Trametes coccinea BRFM310]|uniref:Uncharacterized protein n=1 Tax=Trametes coccinea (strain BRFM310) TaxID=1353009 RepID=A0A1Y2II13_TRAC3|nr:hypothetical protein PYCCODRAFT_1469016 [Trametes coccinea BRFM310]
MGAAFYCGFCFSSTPSQAANAENAGSLSATAQRSSDPLELAKRGATDRSAVTEDDVSSVRSEPQDDDESAAIAWGDLSLWLRAVKSCDAERSIAALQDRNVLEALKKFGFPAIRTCSECTLGRDPSNLGVLQFLERSESWIATWGTSEQAQIMRSWVVTRRAKCLDNLKRPLKDEAKSLSALITQYKGADFLENKSIPLAQESGDSALLLEFATHISKEEAIPAEARSRMALKLLKFSLAHMDFYAPVPQKPPAGPTYSWRPYTRPAEEPQQLERAKPYLALCLELGDMDLLSLAPNKLLAVAGQTAEITLRRTRDVLLPLISFAQDAPGSRLGGSAQAALQQLSTSAASLYLQALTASPRNILLIDVSSLIKVMISGGQPEDVIKIVALTNAGYFATPTARVKPAIEALNLCFNIELPEACRLVLHRFIHPPKLDVAYISTYLGPLIPELHALLAKHKTPISAEPFASTFCTILLYWVQHVMGPRPLDTSATYIGALKAWTCNCHICPAVQTFLTSKPEESCSWQRIGAPTWRHVETFLTRHARAIATFDTFRTTPQGLQKMSNL